VVSRCGREVRYIIDYYHDDAADKGLDKLPEPHAWDTSIRSITLVVRPALDSLSALWDRVRSAVTGLPALPPPPPHLAAAAAAGAAGATSATTPAAATGAAAQPFTRAAAKVVFPDSTLGEEEFGFLAGLTLARTRELNSAMMTRCTPVALQHKANLEAGGCLGWRGRGWWWWGGGSRMRASTHIPLACWLALLCLTGHLGVRRVCVLVYGSVSMGQCVARGWPWVWLCARSFLKWYHAAGLWSSGMALPPRCLSCIAECRPLPPPRAVVCGPCTCTGADEGTLQASHIAYVSCLGSVVAPPTAAAFGAALDKGDGDAADAHFAELSSRVWRYKHMAAKLESEALE
jgi:hypothetical protein